jgi:3-oxoacyl-[acyl-carrier-protein] synthase III
MFLRAVERNKLSAKSLYFLGTQLSAAMLQSICQRHGIKSEQQLQNVREQGYSFGSAPAAVLADLWEKIRAGSDVVVSIAGAGMSFGYVYLKA